MPRWYCTSKCTMYLYIHDFIFYFVAPLPKFFIFIIYYFIFRSLHSSLHIYSTYIYTYIHTCPPYCFKNNFYMAWPYRTSISLACFAAFFLKKKKNHSNRSAAKYREKTYRDIGIYLISSFTVLLILRSNKRLDWIVRLEWLSSEMR